jgi:TonB family protein
MGMRQIRFYAFLLAMITLLTIGASYNDALAQATGNASDDWATLNPEGDDFTIVMPKDPKFEAGDETYHRMTLHTRLYLSAAGHGPVLAVASLSGIKSNPAMYSEFQRLNSYVDAFKNWFPQKVRGKDAVAKLTLVGEKTLNGNQGREYHLVIGDLSGSAQVYATRKRFYAAVVLNTKKDEVLTDRFFSSFAIPEKIIEAPAAAVATVTPTAPESAGIPSARKKVMADDSQKGDPAAAATAETKPGDPTAAPKPGERAPISGGILNGKAISLPKPEYPAEARAAGASGTVMVQVTIDEAGNVITAKAISGHPMLQQICVNAAFGARFSPTSLMGEPVKVTGVITYNFAAK